MTRDRDLFDHLDRRSRRRIWLWSTPIWCGLAIACIFAEHVLQRAGILKSGVWALLLRSDLQRTLLNGVLLTAKAAITATVLSVIVGSVLLAIRRSGVSVVSAIATLWIHVARGIPELLMILFVFLGLPAIGFNISLFWAMVAGLILYESAAVEEVLRAGFDALPTGQREAGSAIGLRSAQVVLLIEIPQVVPQVLPNMVSEMVRVTKSTSLGFTIGYMELLSSGQIAIQILGSFSSFPIYLEIAAWYVCMCWILTGISRALARALGGSGGGSRQRPPLSPQIADEPGLDSERRRFHVRSNL